MIVPIFRASRSSDGPVPCPRAESHTPTPNGYVAHAAWAAAMHKTHWQHRCGGCDLWEIWTPRVPGTPPLDPDAFELACIVIPGDVR